MKTSSDFKVLFTLLFIIILMSSCKKEIKEVLKEELEEETEVAMKEGFAFYDAMNYPGKPDLAPAGMLPIYLMYENALTRASLVDNKSIELDLDKVNVMAELAANFPYVMVSTDIEDWFGDSSVNDYIMHDRFKSMFDVFKAKNRNVVIGNYGIAPSALCVYRFYNKGKWNDTELLQNWRLSTAKRWKSIDAGDIIMPAVYIAEPDVQSWIRDLDTTVEEIKKHNPDKKIVVYIWPQYYNKPDSPYNSEIIAPEIWDQMLEAVYNRCDGAIIWSGRTDKDGNTVYWNDPKIQAIWNTTQSFLKSHRQSLMKPLQEPELNTTYNPNKKFKLFGAFTFPEGPTLEPFGIHRIKLVQEKDLSSGAYTNGIYEPLTTKIETMAIDAAKSPNVPICIIGGTWIKDRNTDHEAMVARYEAVKRIFKDKNTTNELGFVFVGGTSLSGLRVSNGNFYVNTAGWMHSAIIPTRPLRQYADYLLPAAYIVDDDIHTWKKEFYFAIKEARKTNPDKPIYAYLYTDYFNQTINFVDSYKPIKEATWEAMLDAVFRMCDGVVMSNLSNTTWDGNMGFWTATKRFIEKYKGNIEFPEIPVPPKEWFVPGNVLDNGSFEQRLKAFAVTEPLYGETYPTLLNCTGFFDETSKMISPTAPATTMEKYMWFERGTTQSQCRIYVSDMEAKSGEKSVALHNIGGNTSNATATTWMYHNLAQRISLNDTKKYKLTFYAKRNFKYRNVDNMINKLFVGILSATGAL
ncbi:MAG: hypothetical protein LBE37_09305, partial [Sphingobacterium sp.]|nr:hypothetical protein [Sphingobacterium sp.]